MVLHCRHRPAQGGIYFYLINLYINAYSSLFRYVDVDGEEIDRNEAGIPLDNDGRPLPKNNKGEYVFIPVGVQRPDEVLTQTPASAEKPLDQILASESGEQTITEPPPPPPAVIPQSEVRTTALPRPTITAASSELVVVGPDGYPLPTDDAGRFVSSEGVPISTDIAGRPLDKNNEVLPTNDLGEFVYLPPAQKPKTQVVLVGPEGQILPTDRSGIFIGPGGITFPTNKVGVPIGPDSSPLPTNEIGHYIAHLGPAEDDGARVLPTDAYGKEIYPVVDDDGFPLPTDSVTGRHIAANGEVIPIDDFGRPLTEDGLPLPVNNEGAFVYRPPTTTTTTTSSPPTTTDMLPTLEEVLAPGSKFPTDEVCADICDVYHIFPNYHIGAFIFDLPKNPKTNEFTFLPAKIL
jgi:hypothetical protein